MEHGKDTAWNTGTKPAQVSWDTREMVHSEEEEEVTKEVNPWMLMQSEEEEELPTEEAEPKNVRVMAEASRKSIDVKEPPKPPNPNLNTRTILTVVLIVEIKDIELGNAHGK